MSAELVVDRFLTKSGHRIPGALVTTMSATEQGALSVDPLTALEQQHQQEVGMQRSAVTSIEFARWPGEAALEEGSVLVSELFGYPLKIIRCSRAAMSAEVAPASWAGSAL